MSDKNSRFGRRRFLQTTGLLVGMTGLGTVNGAWGNRELYDVSIRNASDQIDVEGVLADRFGSRGYEVVDYIDQLGGAVIALDSTLPSIQADPVAQAEAHPRVEYAERVPEIDTHGVSVDETYTRSELMSSVTPEDPLLPEQWAPEKINLDDAWEETFGSMDTSVTIVDNAIDYKHEDLIDQYGSNLGASDPSPDSSRTIHGTHTSGLAAATTNNAVGISGTSDSQLYAYDFDYGVLSAITDAADLGTDVMSHSWGLTSYQDGEWTNWQMLEDAIEYAYEKGVTIFASAGNSRNDSETPDDLGYPAAYEEVIAVGATNESDDVTGFSSSGPDVCAPGARVLSTITDNRYADLSGTSMSCPITAGVGALLLDVDPSLGQEDIRSILKETAVDIGASTKLQGAGRIDAAAAVSAVTGSSPEEQAPYKGPHTIPGRVEAENFDKGGPGVAFSDTDSSNNGGAYRDTAVDIQSSTEGGYNVGWIESGEWLEYTVEVESAGTYEFFARVATEDDGGSFFVEAGGQTQKAGFDSTGSWNTWTTVSVGTFDLEAGEQVVRVESTNDGWDLNWFELQQSDDNLKDPVDPGSVTNGIDWQLDGYWGNTNTGTTDQIDLEPFRNGGLWQDDITFTGFIKVPEDGEYSFTVTADDRAKLTIGGTDVVSTSGTSTGSIGLNAGYHAIRVDYVEEYGGVALGVEWDGPGVSAGTVPASALYVNK